MSKPTKVLFLMSGSVAAFKSCQVISRLIQDGCDVQVVTTPSVQHFVGLATLEGLSGKKVLTDLWESGHAMDHIHLTRWADYALLCPASANTVARLAHGFADDLVSAMALAWPVEKAFWIVPAMNHQMLAARVTQNNLATLADRGFSVLPTQSGPLACGEEGYGRMLEPDEILRRIGRAAPTSLGHILITGGATREPIDGIRFLSNVSTGHTAATLCDYLAAQGWRVTHLRGTGAAHARSAAREVPFTTFVDLDHKLRQELGSQDYNAVIHCAAVSDFSLENPDTAVKLSGANELSLKLKPNFKILPRLKEYSRNRTVTVVGFKLTLNNASDQTFAAARSAISDSVDAVVANDWSAVERDRHPGTLVLRDGNRQDFLNLQSLGQLLHSLLTKGSIHGVSP